MDNAHGAVLYGGSSLADELGESTPGGGLAAELGKVADKYSWMVILSNRKHIEELRRAPEDVLSFFQATTDVSNYPVPQELTCILAFRPFSCPALFFRWRSQRHGGFEQCACLPSSHRMPVSRMVCSKYNHFEPIRTNHAGHLPYIHTTLQSPDRSDNIDLLLTHPPT